MKTKVTLRLALLVMFVVTTTTLWAQRKITGTVYLDGKPAAGVTVTAHKASTDFFTSFDGKYELEISDNSKYIKFEYPTEIYKLDIEGKTDAVFDYFVGKKPVALSGEADMRSQKELISEGVDDYKNNYSLYSQALGQKDFKSAEDKWKKVYKRYPKSALSLYVHGVKIYKGLIANATTQEEKQLYVDSAMQIFDNRIKHFGDKSTVLGLKATAIYEMLMADTDLNDAEKTAVHKRAYGVLGEAWEASGEEVALPVVYEYMKASKGLFKSGELTAEQMIVNYEKCMAVCESTLAADPDDEMAVKVCSAVNSLFETSGAADCDALIAIYTPKFEENPNDIEFISKMMRQLSRNECTDSELFQRGSEKQYELEPSAQAALQMAQRFVKEDNIDKALEYYKEVISLGGDDQELLGNTYYGMAAIYMSKKHDYATARTYARKTISARPNWGRGYMMMANIYQLSAPKFGSNAFEKSTVYWVVADYFNKAASVDPEVASDARAKAASFKKYFPSKEDLFFNKNMSVGESYTVEGWINERTKTRSKD